MFVWYEDLKRNPSKVIADLSKFLGYELSPEKIEALVKHVSIENMRELGRKSAPPGKEDMISDFFRKGTVGDWVNYFEGDRLKEWNEWIEKSIEGTDIVLPADKL